MRILLLGELSGVHQELAPGLRALGHEVVVGHGKMANPDFASDIPFYRAPKGTIPLALGAAFAAKEKKRGQVAVVFFGDGVPTALEIGGFTLKRIRDAGAGATN